MTSISMYMYCTCTLIYTFTIDRISLNPVAKQHPLFPLLDQVIRLLYQQDHQLKQISYKVGKIDENYQSLNKVVDDLFHLQQEGMKTQYNVRDAGIEVCDYIMKILNRLIHIKYMHLVLTEYGFLNMSANANNHATLN